MIGVPVALVVWLALIPLVFLLWQSFLTPQTATAPALFTLENYRTAYRQRRQRAAVRQFAPVRRRRRRCSSFGVGTGARVDERAHQHAVQVAVLRALAHPAGHPRILFTVAWILLASPKIGIVNLVAAEAASIPTPCSNIYSMAGMIWVDGLHYSPMAFLLMTAAFRAMDPSLEESAAMSGACVLQVAWRITLQARLAGGSRDDADPLRALDRIVRGAGAARDCRSASRCSPRRSTRRSTAIRARSASPPPTPWRCSLLTTVGIYAQSRLSSQGARYATMTGKGFRPRTIDLGKLALVHGGDLRPLLRADRGAAVPGAVVVVVPAVLHRAVDGGAGRVSLDPYRFILGYPDFADTVWNSLVLAFGTATIVMLVTSVICWIVVKTKMPGRWLLDNVASLPLVFPGLVLGLAIMIFYLNIDIGIYGTIWIMFIAYITRFMPYGLRYNTTSMLQIHKELEESAAMSGASWATTFRRVVLPLLKPGLLAGWIYVMIVSIRELSTSILLYRPGTEVVSIVIWELWENGQYVELSALGVMLIVALFVLVMLAQLVGRRFGIAET